MSYRTIVSQNSADVPNGAGIQLEQLNAFLAQAGYDYSEHYIDAYLVIPKGVNQYKKWQHTAVFTSYTDAGIQREVSDGFKVLAVYIYIFEDGEKRPVAILGTMPGVDIGEELAQQLFLFQQDAALVAVMA